MVKQSKVKKQKLGKGKVTPVQIAFIVDRYLANNSYSATLASFRSEASDLLSRTQGKEAPKGLMGLADILDDYISLKEQRLMIDREKQRLETALQGMQEVMRAYNSGTAVGSVPAPLPVSSPIPPQGLGSPMVPSYFMSHLASGSPTGHMIPGPSTMNHTPPSLLTMAGEGNRQLAPTDTQASTEKKRASKPTTRETLLQKRPRTELPAVSNKDAGHDSEACTSNSLTVETKSADKLSTLPSVRGSSLVMAVGSQRNSSSPKTPPQGFSSQINHSSSPVQNSAINDVVDADITQKLMNSTNCAMVSSETIIISPSKVQGYYAVERSCRVTYSPLKPSDPKKFSKREQIKGRLDFDEADELEGSQKLSCAETCISSSDEETHLDFDFDLPDFEMLDGDFLSGLLVDIEGDYEGVPNCSTASPLDVTGPEQDVSGGSLEMKQILPDSSPSEDAGTISKHNINFR
ncbi:hypothetical protein AXF42_Ash015379 [Apostasia shenzhenica]|uniref:LisH domain-containing protein n=1 Tax=Apostasia shenzhenica TaxID=1088818 RepID=A0A2H9ZS31_9ASPA|nr:hypothetical protein AXF42_Ash015379 [Apostasia shenzhenica]